MLRNIKLLWSRVILKWTFLTPETKFGITFTASMLTVIAAVWTFTVFH